ncbi:MAG: phage scaffolding protein [Negativibacillus massiliensis]|nr:phage scaffolding protein [Negativibacillus massiliensis]
MSLFELLAKHGIEVPEEKKQGLETEFSESYREAQEFKELNTELEGVKGQLSQANEQIAGFKELDIEGVKQKAAEWEQKYNQAAENSAREIEQLKFDFALDKELTKAQARNPKAVKALLDRDALKYDKGKIIGLEEQLETLKKGEDSAFLFGSAAPTVQFTTQSQSFQQMNDNDARAVMGLAPVK